MREIREIIIHCTATPRDREVTVEDIDRWHRQRGFAGIGYHKVIYPDGTVHDGRPIEKIGAHCLGHNANSIGVVYVGGMEKDGSSADTRTEAQKESLKRVIEELQREFPRATVHGHREFSATACPGFDVNSE